MKYEPVGGGIEDIIEKPEVPPSNDAVIGLYMYDNTVFDKIEKLSPSDRGELEITDINRMYLAEDRLSVNRISGTWLDCGTPESLATATQIMKDDAVALAANA